jgi:hypothetical protein
MNISVDLPIWAVVLLCLLLAAILILQNLGWLLSFRAMFAWRRRRGGDSGPDAPTAEPEESTGSLDR